MPSFVKISIVPRSRIVTVALPSTKSNFSITLRSIVERSNSGISILPVTPLKSPLTRASAIDDMISLGRVISK